jgi:hypothetical protein
MLHDLKIFQKTYTFLFWTKQVVQKLGKSDFPSRGYKTESAALAGDASFTYVSRLMPAWTALVSLIVSKPIGVSSKAGASVDRAYLKPEEGIEPSGRALTRAVPHQASGWQGAYQTSSQTQKPGLQETENAALAGGASSTSKVAKRYEREVDTSVNIADRTFLSRHKNALVYKAFLKAVEGLEPSRGEVSTSLSHHATAAPASYQRVFDKAKRG